MCALYHLTLQSAVRGFLTFNREVISLTKEQLVVCVLAHRCLCIYFQSSSFISFFYQPIDKELQTFSEIVAANLSHIEQLHSCNTPLWLRYIMNWPLIKSKCISF